jgi:hypothetical protein
MKITNNQITTTKMKARYGNDSYLMLDIYVAICYNCYRR